MSDIPRTMKALIKESDVTSYVFKDIDVPEPVGDEVLIKVTSVSFKMYTF